MQHEKTTPNNLFWIIAACVCVCVLPRSERKKAIKLGKKKEEKESKKVGESPNKQSAHRFFAYTKPPNPLPPPQQPTPPGPHPHISPHHPLSLRPVRPAPRRTARLLHAPLIVHSGKKKKKKEHISTRSAPRPIGQKLPAREKRKQKARPPRSERNLKICS